MPPTQARIADRPARASGANGGWKTGVVGTQFRKAE